MTLADNCCDCGETINVEKRVYVTVDGVRCARCQMDTVLLGQLSLISASVERIARELAELAREEIEGEKPTQHAPMGHA